MDDIMAYQIPTQAKTLKTAGSRRANDKVDVVLTGTITAVENIDQEKYPSMFKKLIIKVDGEVADFEDVINYTWWQKDASGRPVIGTDGNPVYDENNNRRSLGFIQYHIKQALLAAGEQVDAKEEWGIDECIAKMSSLVGKTVKFKQYRDTNSRNGKSCNKIQYLN